MDLLETFLRAQALESLLTQAVGPSQETDGVSPRSRSLVPALPAAAALEARSDGRGDLLSLRVGSPASALAFGARPHDLLRQALGRDTAPARGRDAAGLPTDWDRGWVGSIPLPGALMEVMAGIAMALRMRGEPRVALLVDDTAGSGSGDWHEGLNLAVVRQAPLVVVNHDVRGGTVDAGMVPMSDRAEGYGFRVWHALDSDPLGLLDVCREAVSAARAGEGVQVVDVRVEPGTTEEDLVAALRTETVDDEALEGLRNEASREMGAALEEVGQEPDPAPGAVLVAPPTRSVAGLPRVRTARPWS